MKIKNKAKKSRLSATKTRKNKIRKQRGVFIAKLTIFIVIVSLCVFLYLNINKIFNSFYMYTAKLGFVVENISIEGQKHVSEERIVRAIKIKTGYPIFLVSLENLKSRLENIEWIKNVFVERKLPNNITIYIEERTPIALGQRDNKLYLIDNEGVIIHEKDLKPYFNLPIFIGDGSEIYANSLITIFREEPELFKHIHAIIRVSERRWNIRLDNDLEIKMPEENFEEAWKKVIKLYKKKELLNPEISVIDLRVANKIFVEKR